MMDRDNRKSHLAPQLSPATQELLRSSDSPTYATQGDVGYQQTPTAGGEIPSSLAKRHFGLLTNSEGYRQAADHAGLAAQVDRLYIRDWDRD